MKCSSTCGLGGWGEGQFCAAAYAGGHATAAYAGGHTTAAVLCAATAAVLCAVGCTSPPTPGPPPCNPLTPHACAAPQ